MFAWSRVSPLILRRRPAAGHSFSVLYSTTTISTPPNVASNGPNDDILKMLLKCKAHCGHEYKWRTFTIAHDAIAALPTRLSGPDDSRLTEIKGIGPGIRERVRRVLAGWNIEDVVLSTYESVEKPVVLQPVVKAPPGILKHTSAEELHVRTLRQLPGLGPRTAEKLIEMGCTSLEQLRADSRFMALLSPAQRINAQYFDQLKVMPLAKEANIICAAIKKRLDTLSGPHAILPRDTSPDDEWQVRVVGPHRRGFEQNTDVQLLIYHPNYTYDTTMPLPPHLQTPANNPKSAGRTRLHFRISSLIDSPLRRLIVPDLTVSELIVATLVTTSYRWRGIAKVPSTRDRYVRLDISLCPYKSSGAGLLALTGDDEFYHHCQTEAERRGMMLNEYGLWRWEDGPLKTHEDGDETSKRKLHPKRYGRPPSLPDQALPGCWVSMDAGEKGPSEEDILSYLNLEWVAPEKRNFAYLLPPKKRRL